MFIYLHDREKPEHQGKKYPVLINLDHIESVRNYSGKALLWFHDDTGEERSFLAEESFESVVAKMEVGGILMERIDKKRQIIIDDNERVDLLKQFEQMFIQADSDTSGCMYSGDNIKRKFPKVWELFRLMCL